MAVKMFGPPVLSDTTTAPQDISVTASPQVIQNTSIYSVDILVSGGTVTTLEYSRNGTNYYVVGLLAGIVRLSPGDYLRIAYAVAPTTLRRIFR